MRLNTNYVNNSSDATVEGVIGIFLIGISLLNVPCSGEEKSSPDLTATAIREKKIEEILDKKLKEERSATERERAEYRRELENSRKAEEQRRRNAQ